jgi:hypothetical protein
MSISERGHLRKMRNNKDLSSARQSRETTSHFYSGSTTDTRVNLVEHQSASRFGPCDRNLEGEHDA